MADEPRLTIVEYAGGRTLAGVIDRANEFFTFVPLPVWFRQGDHYQAEITRIGVVFTTPRRPHPSQIEGIGRNLGRILDVFDEQFVAAGDPANPGAFFAIVDPVEQLRRFGVITEGNELGGVTVMPSFFGRDP